MDSNLSETGQSIKELTADLHDELEAKPFNKKMFAGQLTKFERQVYIASWIPIFKQLDPYVPDEMKRVHSLEAAQESLGHPEPPVLDVWGYVHYLNGWHARNNRSLNGHIYLNYMGFMYGGQIMKKKYPQSSQMYEFDDINYWRQYVRDTYVDMSEEFVYEVKNGFRMHLNICDELARVCHVKMGDDGQSFAVA